MRIVSWNCGGQRCGGLTIEKYNEMLRFNPDILIIQECTKKDFDFVRNNSEWGNGILYLARRTSDDQEYLVDYQHWYGDNKEKSNSGLAIIAPDYIIDLVDNFNSKFRYFVPYKISSQVSELFSRINRGDGNNETIDEKAILVSIWTQPPSDGSQDYQKTIFDALDYYNFDVPIILAGDFYTGSNRENMYRYEELKTKLEKYGLKNCAANTEYEYEPTFYHDKTNNYYTNDFCFIPRNLNVYEYRVDKMNNQKRWKGFSDHCPIIADFGVAL